MKMKEASVLLTGAGGGIASAIARELAGAGSKLLLTDLNADALTAVVDAIGSPGNQVSTFAGDITDSADRAQLIARAHAARVNVLINAAGINPFGLLEEQSPRQIELALKVNLLAPMMLCQEMLPVLRSSRRSSIVNIGSSFGAIGFPCFATYSATKFGVRGFSEALRRELAGSSINVQYVAPRATQTRLVTDRIKAMNDELKVGMDMPEDVARAVLRVLEHDTHQHSLGLPERIYGKLNAVFPRLVDWALVRQLPTIVRFARGTSSGPTQPLNLPPNVMESQS